GAEAEAAQVEEGVALKDVSIRDAMLTEFHTLHPLDTLGHAADLLLAGTQHDFPIVGEGDHEFKGLLTRSDLLAGLSRGGREALVADYARTEIPCVDSDNPLSAAVTRLREAQTPCLQVMERNETVGLLTLENIGELLMVRAALGQEGDIPPGPGQRLAQTRN
ncbi:MAG: CBS domain-containing protein, partial [Isosphaeraceae bacterium]